MALVLYPLMTLETTRTETSTTSSEKSHKQKKQKKRTKKLVVCIDLGTSLIKVVYWVNGVVKWLVVEPEYIRLPYSAAEKLPVNSGFGLPENSAWIKYHSPKADCHLVGRLASDYKAFTHFKTLKWEIATPKILPIIGAIFEREKLPTSSRKVALVLGVLLPVEEMGAHERLSSELKTKLSRGFFFREEFLNLSVTSISIVPESSGLTLQDAQLETFASDNWGYLMWGHKHAAFSFYRQGTLSKRESAIKDLGFFNLNQLLRETIPGWEAKHLFMALEKFNSIHSQENSSNNDSPKGAAKLPINWVRLLKLRGYKSIGVDYPFLKDTGFKSINEFWALFSSWLDEVLPSKKEIDYLVFSGGTSQLFKPLLVDYFCGVKRCFWTEHADLVLKTLALEDRSSPSRRQFLDNNYPQRFADVVGLFNALSGYNPQKDNQPNGKSGKKQSSTTTTQQEKEKTQR